MKVAEDLYQSGFISYPRTETDGFPPGMDLMVSQLSYIHLIFMLPLMPLSLARILTELLLAPSAERDQALIFCSLPTDLETSII